MTFLQCWMHALYTWPWPRKVMLQGWPNCCTTLKPCAPLKVLMFSQAYNIPGTPPKLRQCLPEVPVRLFSAGPSQQSPGAESSKAAAQAAAASDSAEQEAAVQVAVIACNMPQCAREAACR